MSTAPANSLRACIANATGAWLYQEYAMFGDGAQVAADYGLPGGGGLGLCSGGLPPEGMLYGHYYGYLLGQLRTILMHARVFLVFEWDSGLAQRMGELSRVDHGNIGLGPDLATRRRRYPGSERTLRGYAHARSSPDRRSRLPQTSFAAKPAQSSRTRLT